ncbi:hypothetical protein ACFLXP_05635 [Chloroflexota bacterium]
MPYILSIDIQYCQVGWQNAGKKGLIKGVQVQYSGRYCTMSRTFELPFSLV